MRRLPNAVLVLTVALTAVPWPAVAQSGVLIGLTTERQYPESGEGSPAPTLRTIWITHESARTGRVTTIPSLVLPRRDSFWRVGLTTVCERDENGTNQSDRDVLWIVPVSGTPVVTQGPLCASVERARRGAKRGL